MIIIPITPIHTENFNYKLRGFTLVEMVVCVAILGILTAIGIPAFNEVALSSKLRSYANNFVASVYLARSEAIKSNSSVTLCVSTNGTSCGSGGWQQGWIVLNNTTVIRKQEALSTGFKMTEASGLSNLTFQPTGIGATQATLVVCRATPSVGSQERVVTVGATGKPSVKKTMNASCS